MMGRASEWVREGLFLEILKVLVLQIKRPLGRLPESGIEGTSHKRSSHFA